MRTLKKALCLVLVLAMVLSLSVSAFAVDKAADYKDYSKVENKEAVDVLTAIGVLNGNDDGTFGPDGAFTRAQAAKMICYLTLGKTVADALSAGATQFNDVPATHWASKYIQYCANEGIIAGVGDNKFNPEGTLTAAAWAKMLLCALGYDQAAEGLTGTGWEINVTRLAMTAKVATAEELTAAFNRDMAAQLAFNTLKCKLVEYSGGVEIVGADGSKVTVNATRVVSQETLAEKVFPTLKTVATTKTDAFKRPAVEWKLGSKSIGVYADEPVLTYTTAVKGSDLYKDLGLAAAMKTGVAYYVDGFQTVATGWDDNVGLAKTATWSVGGNGTVTEVFTTTDVNGDIATVTIVEVRTYVGTVTGVTKANAKTGAARSITIADAPSAFDTEEFAIDDVVLYTKASNKVQSVALAESDSVTATWRNDTSFVADGTTYKYSATASTKIAAADVTNKTAKVVYFDDYGYVIKVADATAAAPKYAYVLQTGKESSIFDGDTHYAKLLYTDGTVEAVKIVSGDESLLNHIVTYAEGTGANAGKIDLTDVTGAAYGATGTYEFDKNIASQHGAVLNNKTVFVVETTAADGSKVYTSYTGVTNIPALTCTRVAGIAKDGVWTVYFALGATLKTATVTSKDVVFVNGASATTAVDVTKGEYKTYTAVVNGEITTIEAATTADLNGLYGALTKNDKGLVTSGTVLAGDKIALVSKTGTAVASNGVIALGGTNFIYNDATVVYVINEDNTISESSIGAIEASSTASVTGYTTDGILTMLVVK